MEVVASSNRQVERGIKRFRCHGACLIISQHAFVWGLALRESDWSTISVVDHEDARTPSPITEAAESRLGRRLKRQSMAAALSSISSFNFILISGDLDFVRRHWDSFTSQLSLEAVTGLIVLERFAGRRLPTIDHITWRRISHQFVGGSTTTRLWMGFFGQATTAHLEQAVQRQIAHILDHSLRPKPCKLPASFVHLTPQDRLTWSAEGVQLPVVYPTSFSFSGFGYRTLSPPELGAAVDLPVALCKDQQFMETGITDGWLLSLPPYKILTASLEACLRLPRSSALTDDSPKAKRPRANEYSPLLSPAPVVADPRGDWLPSLEKWLPPIWADQAYVSDKAAKADDAEIHTAMWDLRITTVFPHVPKSVFDRLLTWFRRCCLIRWRVNVYRSFCRYLLRAHGHDWLTQLQGLRRQGGVSAVSPEETPELLVDAQAGIQVLRQNLGAEWWDWTEGSALIFWRWSTPFQVRCARDGIPIFVQGRLPRNHKAQRPVAPEARKLYGKKLSKVRRRGYIQEGHVESLTHMFHVPKGETDIRMVYDGTSSGLNAALWAPSFWLPNAETALRMYDFNSFCVDIDLGEMFLNFPMDSAIQPYAGVDLTQLQSEFEDTRNKRRPVLWERWSRLFMGMKPSPYNAARHYYWAEELFTGNPAATCNPFRYDRVITNLPGTKEYDPTQPYVFKWRDFERIRTGGISAYVDDLRAAGYSRENSWQIARRAASIMQYLGIQDAPRKRRPSTQRPGAWAGGIHTITPERITKSVTQEKWDKGRAQVQALLEVFNQAVEGIPASFDHKDLEKKRGFLVHLGMTFPSIIPFLKGIHLTLDSWRPDRGPDGWRLSARAWRELAEASASEGVLPEELLDAHLEGAPRVVKSVPRMKNDVKALWRLFSSESPPEVAVRVRHILAIIYGFGDASGTGFGSTFATEDGISYRIGVWSETESSEESSNWREFTNVVEALEEEASSGGLKDTEIFFFTDNFVVETATYKGTSSSPKLLALVIRLRELEMKHSVRLHVIHVAGTRMIAQGSDGVSRGALNEGVMNGQDMMSFVPLARTAVERAPALADWLTSWAGNGAEILTPTDWFGKGHDIRSWACPTAEDLFARPVIQAGTWIWAPPPAAADVAMEELRKARLKRQNSTHVVVIPRLWTGKWLRQLYKAADIVFPIVPAAHKLYWPKEMHEPLLIGIAFPFLRCKPWQLRGTPRMYATTRKLQSMSEDPDMDEGDFLCKFCEESRGLVALPRDVVSRMLHFKSELD